MFTKRPQASASVRGASDLCRTCVGLVSDLPETKIVGKCRTVVTFYVSYCKSVNSHRDRGGRSRETQNCRHFWTRVGSSRVKSVNGHRDRGGRGRETQNCHHFWTLKSVNSHRDRGGRGRETQNCRHFWTRLASSRLKSVNRIGGRGRETQYCRHFWTRLASSRLKSVNSHRDRGGRRRETQNCRHFWTRRWREKRREER